jgi:hypothetical protein
MPSLRDIVAQANIIHIQLLTLFQVMNVFERVKREVGNVTVIINCCNLPSPRVLTAHPAPEVCSILDVGVMSQFWVSLEDWCVSYFWVNLKHVSCYISG